MTIPRIPSLAALALIACALAPPALAAKRGGWDGNGTAVRGMAADTAGGVESAPQKLRAITLPPAGAPEWSRRGGWDANGTAPRGSAVEVAPMHLRGVQLPTAAAAR